MPQTIKLSTSSLSTKQVVAAARGEVVVSITPASIDAMERSRAVVNACLTDGEPHYGINTGFGSLSRKRIGSADLQDLQRNLIRSHSAGVGDPLPVEVVRALMLLLAGSLARGLSGVRPAVPRLLADMLSRGVTPIVPSLGSVGASGDLAPLAAVGLVMIGEGRAIYQGVELDGEKALRAAGLKPITLEAKEGLAIINGTHLMCARGALLCHDAELFLDTAMTAAAMSIDASRGTDAFLDARVHTARQQPGQKAVAERLRKLLAGSEIVASHRENDPRVQDPYSLRCTPQVLGAAWDCLSYVKQAVERELGAVTDNPLVFAKGKGGDIVSAGNFHGMPLAIPLDCLAIALAHVAGISERRTFWMLSAFDPENHLKAYLSPQPGLNSGLMIAQYTAAALCNEIIGLCMPASVANVSTSAGIEDYNSFGPRAAAKADRVLRLAEQVVAIELLCAAQGIDVHRPLRSGKRVEAAHKELRSVVPTLREDRPPTADIQAIHALIRAGALA